MACHLSGKVWIPLEEFWKDLIEELRKEESLASVLENRFFAVRSMDFGGKRSLAPEGCFTGLLVEERNIASPVNEIRESESARFVVGLEMIWKLCEAYGVNVSRHEVAYGVPRIEAGDLVVDVVINSENVRATSDFERVIRPQWA